MDAWGHPTVELEWDGSGVFGWICAPRREREKGTGVMTTELMLRGIRSPRKR